MKGQKIIWIVLLICVVIYTIPNLMYIIKFGNGSISNKQEIWGQYGDFIGGFTNPILTIVNIFALIYLTYTVSKIEDNRFLETINAQKIITITEMRHEVISDFKKELSRIGDFRDSKEAISILENNAGKIIFFRQHNEYLFKDLFEEGFTNNYLTPISTCIDDIREAIQIGNKEELKKLLLDYIELQNKCIAVLNKNIIKELTL